MIRYLFTVFLLTVLPFISLAQESSESTQEEHLDKIFEYIPFEGKLNDSPQDLNEQFSQNPFGLSEEDNQQMMDLFLEAFTSDTLVNQAKEIFREKYNAEHAQSTVQKLENGSLEAIYKAEKEFYSLQGIRKRVVNRYEMEQDPASEDRTELMEALVEKMSASDAEIEAQITLFRAIVEAFGALGDQSMGQSQIDGFVNNYRGQIEGQVEQEIGNQFLLRYHELDEETLQNYDSFLESEAGSWLSETSSEAVQSAYQQASDQFLESIRNL